MTDVNDDLRKRVVSKVTRRIMPFIFLCYVIAYLDRVNIGMAEGLQAYLKLNKTEYGLGGGLFFFGYFLFEVPSNLILHRVGARIWIARIMIVWGLVSMATMFVRDGTSFYVARVLLGVAEAGFFPGMVLYFTYWIPASERARTGALFMMAAPIAIIVGAPVSEALLALDGRGGLAGWQWLFLVEGAPAVLLGLAALSVLTDRPEHASWLRPAEREWLTTKMESERQARATVGEHAFSAALRSPKVWLLAAIYFLNTLVTYGVFLWLPKIVRDLSGSGGWKLSVLTSIPFVAALIGMFVIGRHSDRTRERKKHVAGRDAAERAQDGEAGDGNQRAEVFRRERELHRIEAHHPERVHMCLLNTPNVLKKLRDCGSEAATRSGDRPPSSPTPAASS